MFKTRYGEKVLYIYFFKCTAYDDNGLFLLLKNRNHKIFDTTVFTHAILYALENTLKTSKSIQFGGDHCFF